ncbi:hypothetical protein [Treponema sp.]|uniref:hypothetical protein n=1 Tax=Treponema sp. TaxID=166 RepID=UPI00388E3E21
MTSNGYKAIADSMSALGLNYGLLEYVADPIVYPYWVGSNSPRETDSEDGLSEDTFMLNGFTRSTLSELQADSESIESYFSRNGKFITAADGSAVIIIFSGSQMIPTGEEELKRIQVNLIIKEYGVK